MGLRARRAVWRLSLVLAFGSLVGGCVGPPSRPAPAEPAADARLDLGEPTVSQRSGSPGGAVDCSVSVVNKSGRTLTTLVLACELLDADGVPVGSGLGTAQNLANGQSRSIRSLVYGVRSFANARARVTSAVFQ